MSLTVSTFFLLNFLINTIMTLPQSLQETGQFIFPFMNRVGVVFVVSLIAAAIVSLLVPAKPDAMKIKLDKISYKTSLGFNLAGAGVIAFLILVYKIWW